MASRLRRTRVVAQRARLHQRARPPRGGPPKSDLHRDDLPVGQNEQAFMTDPSLAEAMDRAGVTAPPAVHGADAE